MTNGTNTATYSYVANSPLVSQILFANNGTTRMTTTKQYDLLNRLTNIANVPSADPTLSFAYQYTNSNQRTRITEADGSYWLYTYDSLGQVTSGKKYWSDGSPVLGQQFEYAFDDIGNRKTAVSGGNALGQNKRTQTYGANELNQYTNRTVPAYLDIIGTATNAATVTVNATATSRKDNYYRAELQVPNDSSAVWQSITNTAVLASGTNDLVTNSIGKLFLPKTPETFIYDFDGNLTSDGRWTNTWDGENRLTKMESLPGAPVGSSNRLTFYYDHQSRRTAKLVQSFTNGNWAITLANSFVYDGWNLLAELNSTNKALINSYVWGLDLSGSLQGAGGVGGLLVVNGGTNGGHFVASDANGNIVALMKVTTSAWSVEYSYDPFGNILKNSGTMGGSNPFTFASKYLDSESALSYYGYRYLTAKIGRWINRDPIEENGGQNLYMFVRNSAVAFIDALGQVPTTSVYICWPKCGDRIYNPMFECCCKGKIVSTRATDTGIVRYTWRESGGQGGGRLHTWIQWNGGSVDSNSEDMQIVKRESEMRRIKSAAGWTQPTNDSRTSVTTRISLSPCSYDFEKLNECLSREAALLRGTLGGDCRDFASHFLGAILSKCKDQGKGCTAPK